jgi:hypothetical protein
MIPVAEEKCHLAVQEESCIFVDDVLDVAVEDRGADALEGVERALCRTKWFKCQLPNSVTKRFVEKIAKTILSNNCPKWSLTK